MAGGGGDSSFSGGDFGTSDMKVRSFTSRSRGGIWELGACSAKKEKVDVLGLRGKGLGVEGYEGGSAGAALVAPGAQLGPPHHSCC